MLINGFFGTIGGAATGLIAILLLIGITVWFVISGYKRLAHDWRPLFLGGITLGVIGAVAEYIVGATPLKSAAADALAFVIAFGLAYLVYRTAHIKYIRYVDRLSPSEDGKIAAMLQAEIDTAIKTDIRSLWLWAGLYVVVAALFGTAYYLFEPFRPSSFLGRYRLPLAVAIGAILAPLVLWPANRLARKRAVQRKVKANQARLNAVENATIADADKRIASAKETEKPITSTLKVIDPLSDDEIMRYARTAKGRTYLRSVYMGDPVHEAYVESLGVDITAP